jgi:hypothetical protein
MAFTFTPTREAILQDKTDQQNIPEIIGVLVDGQPHAAAASKEGAWEKKPSLQADGSGTIAKRAKKALTRCKLRALVNDVITHTRQLCESSASYIRASTRVIELSCHHHVLSYFLKYIVTLKPVEKTTLTRSLIASAIERRNRPRRGAGYQFRRPRH